MGCSDCTPTPAVPVSFGYEMGTTVEGCTGDCGSTSGAIIEGEMMETPATTDTEA